MTARALIDETFRLWQHSDALAREAATGEDPEQVAEYYVRAGSGGQGVTRPTYLRVAQQLQERPPSPDDWAAVERREVARLQDAHAAAEAAREQYERLTAERGAIMAEMVFAGHTYADVGRMVGVSRSRASQLVAAHRQRVADQVWTEGDW